MSGEEKLEEYYADDARRFHGVVDRILSKFGGIYQKDKDDFYSLANEVLADACRNYDETNNFDGYVYSCLSNRIKTEITRLNREKRRADRLAVSIEMPLGTEENLTVGDVLAADFDMEKELEERRVLRERNYGAAGQRSADRCVDEKISQYYRRLSRVQRQIVELKMEDVAAGEIKSRLHLTDRQYERHCREMRSFDRVCILGERREERKAGFEKRERTAEGFSQTSEQCRQEHCSIASMIRKMDSGAFRFDHPVQREAGQWNTGMKGNLISDILQDNPVPALVFAHQIVDGMVVNWNLDGKQRCVNVYEFYHDGFRISRNVRRWLIRYQTAAGNVSGMVVGEEEIPQYEWRECDIRGKKYSELPAELQERFHHYNFEVLRYFNCSGDDISYHTARYNEGCPMTQSQKGMTRLGADSASRVKSISGMDFFKEQGCYNESEFRNGTISRVVAESIMACYFLEDWKKQQEEMCDYIREHATAGDFERFEEMVGRLSAVVNEDVAEMFDSKDSFLWFGLFARFGELGLPDEKFVEFMDAFWIGLHEKMVDGVSFDDLDRRSAKDKDVVIGKMRHLERLMMDFLKK